MAGLDSRVLSDVTFQLEWNSSDAGHIDRYFAKGMNLWRDFLPEEIRSGLANKVPGDSHAVSLSPGQIFQDYADSVPRRIRRRQFDSRRIGLTGVVPRRGRFYPKGLLSDLNGVFTANKEPFRCVQVDDGHLMVNLGHPLGDYDLKVVTAVERIYPKKRERGGTSQQWLGLAAEGPGMQARWRQRSTDFFSDNPFNREDESSDFQFYHRPRFVAHIDSTAAGVIRNLYGELLDNRNNVLDLMSSWQSHLPETMAFGKMTGLGLNEMELKKNSQLTGYTVKDLNADPVLPFPNNAFDAVICSLSVEYLISPIEVFSEVARVLEPGGLFITVFSNRWFPHKAVHIWKDLHEFERMGLVLEYFRGTGRFSNLQTFSMRGLERPDDDKYYNQLYVSDPVYAVWGRCI